jgi:hypothetical protein
MLFGYVGKDHIIMSANSRFLPSHGGFNVKDGYPWIQRFGQDMLVGYVGDPADCDELHSKLFGFYREYELRYQGCKLNPKSLIHYARSLMTFHPRPVEIHKGVLLLVGGFVNEEADEETETPTDEDIGTTLNSKIGVSGQDKTQKPKSRPVLYYMDNTYSIHELPYAAHCLQPFALQCVFSVLDQYNRALDSGQQAVETVMRDISMEGETTKSTPWMTPKHRERQRRSQGLKKLTVSDSKRLIEDCWNILQKRSVLSLTTSIQTEFIINYKE